MPSQFYLSVLIGGMLITGASNSLWSKYQDLQCVEDCEPGKRPILFEQPVIQTFQMFVGEMLCFLPIIYDHLRSLYARHTANGAVHLPEEADDADDLGPTKHDMQPLAGLATLLMWIPAVCDLTGTTLMNVGLLYTPVSIYQMTRGALVLFVGALSVIFLRRKLFLYQWLSLLLVMLGVSLVGLSGSLIKDAIREDTDVLTQLRRALAEPQGLAGFTETVPDAPEPVKSPSATSVLIGIFFVLFAQIFTATQFVVEEKIMARYSVAPLVAVGLEGFFGALSVALLVPIILPFLPTDADSPYAIWFDIPRGWRQMSSNPTVLWTSLAIMCSISLFNFFGLSVTRHVSATARSLTDTCRTLLIWIVSLGLGWERLLFPLSVLQVAGFALLVYGTFMFNNLVQPPIKALRPPAPVAVPENAEDEERRGLLEHREQALDETAVLPADSPRTGFDVVPAPAHGGR
jgi:hypothetical protein